MMDPGTVGQTIWEWPALPLDAWQDTQATLHRWLQIVGKVKLELSPFLNEWWNVALVVTARGLTTGPIPHHAGAFDIELDFIAHELHVRAADGRVRTLPLRPQTVAEFHDAFLTALRELGIEVTITPRPVEIAHDAIPFREDRLHGAYDADAVTRWWRIVLRTDLVLQRYRTQFAGKSSPIMFFWGSFDLTAARFCGRSAQVPEGAPRFFQLAEDQENVACGFWPGNANHAGVMLGEPAFYAYIYPEPEGFRDAAIRPDAAAYHPELGQFILPYDSVRTSADPDEAVLAFFESVYDAASTLAGWDRPALALTEPP